MKIFPWKLRGMEQFLMSSDERNGNFPFLLVSSKKSLAYTKFLPPAPSEI